MNIYKMVQRRVGSVPHVKSSLNYWDVTSIGNSTKGKTMTFGTCWAGVLVLNKIHNVTSHTVAYTYLKKFFQRFIVQGIIVQNR